jgi:hypothetical protein
VKQRAGERCEYCQLAQGQSSIPFEIDHVISLKHEGSGTADNLALSCLYCNSAKGPNIAGIDPETGKITPLFHPRQDAWDAHFKWHGAILRGLTPTGRTTIAVLRINSPGQVELRRALIAAQSGQTR